jgi:hypothetical protein
MASLKLIINLCEAGKVQEAYDLAKADLEQERPWAKLITGRALYYFIKEDANNGQYERLVAHLDEMISLGQLMPDNENSIFWIGVFCKRHLAPTAIDTPMRLSALFSRLEEFSCSSGRGYSVLLDGFIRCDSWKETAVFLEWWNLNKLTPEDYQPVEIAPGKKIMSLAERAYISKSKALLRLNDKGRIKAFLPQLDNLMTQHAEMTYPGFFYGKLLLSLGSTVEEELRVLIPFVRRKLTEFWAWQLLSDVFVGDLEKQLACLLRATHCNTQENFLVKVRTKLARLFIQQEQYNFAKYQIDKVTQCSLSNGWRLPFEVECWVLEPWFSSAVSDSRAPLDFSSITDELLCEGTEEAVAVVTYSDIRTGKSSLVFGWEKHMSQRLSIMVGPGVVLKINYIVEPTGRFHIIRAINTQFPNDLNYAKVVEGTVSKHAGRNFAFLKSAEGDFYISPNVVQKYNVVNGETIKSLIVYDYNRNRMTWDWTCISINRKR